MKYVWLPLLLCFIPGHLFGQKFDPNWTHVPSTFPGEDIKPVLAELRKSPVLKEKDEFETKTQYAERIKNLKAIRFGPSSTAENELVFRFAPGRTSYSGMGGIRSSYDAENQLLTVEINLRRLKYLKLTREGFDERAFQGLKIADTELDVIKKPGQLDTHLMRDYYIAVNNALQFGGRGRIWRELKLPAAIAKDAKENMAVLAIGRIVEPFQGLDVTAIEPTRDNPRKLSAGSYFLVADVSQIWFFNERTGEVYIKIKPDASAIKSDPLQ